MERWTLPCELVFHPCRHLLQHHRPSEARLLTCRLRRKDKNLPELSSLGHFLKGSSATLGFTKVKDECEKIQHYGHKKNDTGEVDEPDEDKCLKLIGESLDEAKRAYEVVNGLMKQFYAEV